MKGTEFPMLANHPGEPDLSTVAGLATWIERARSIAFFAGKRHDEISFAEAQWLFEYIRTDFPRDSDRNRVSGEDPAEGLRPKDESAGRQASPENSIGSTRPSMDGVEELAKRCGQALYDLRNSQVAIDDDRVVVDLGPLADVLNLVPDLTEIALASLPLRSDGLQDMGVARSSAGRSAALRVEPPTASQAKPAATNASRLGASALRKVASQIRHRLSDMELRSNVSWPASSPATKTSGYVVSEVADWQLRQWLGIVENVAQGIEAAIADETPAETGGSAEGESPVAEGDAPNPKSVSDSYRDGVEDAAKVADSWGESGSRDRRETAKSIASNIRSLVVKPSGSEE